jgi:NifU-like protein involved in Fe-S cluster formation
MTDFYREDLIDEAKNPSNYGEMSNPDLISTQYNSSCGDIISVSIKLVSIVSLIFFSFDVESKLSSIFELF